MQSQEILVIADKPSLVDHVKFHSSLAMRPFVQSKSDRETLFTESGYGIDAEREFAKTVFKRM